MLSGRVMPGLATPEGPVLIEGKRNGRAFHGERGGMTLRVYRVADWVGRSSVVMTSASGRMTVTTDAFGRVLSEEPFETQIVDSKTIEHRREPENGEFIALTSSRPQGEREYSGSHAVANMLINVVNDERQSEWPRRKRQRRRQAAKDEQRRAELRADIKAGRIPWRTVTILVDGTAVEWQTVSVGESAAAVAFADGTDLAMWSRRVDLGAVQLTLDEVVD
jgi:hypothetical protein